MTTAQKIWLLPEDQHKRLVEIAVEHSRLAAEFGRSDTPEQRKAEIWQRIEELRRERAAILGE
ncbi:hypothetical protein [Effusibacillus pohliae]|uniref:hypothetical protein n=1 Tax=Effusibacillus pohliae TaxID=232270 RepID=UPI000366029B|nr:hypothetical protein [Effusibacillus pohliae]